MVNCLVTKLKAAVNNPYLLKLGEIKISGINTSAAVGNLSLSTSGGTVCRVLGSNNVVFSGNSQKTLNIATGSSLINTTGTADIAVEYANISIINFASQVPAYTESFKNCTKLQEFKARNPIGKLSDMPSSLRNISFTTVNSFGVKDIEGNITDLTTQIKNITFEDCGKIVINFSDLSRFTSINEMLFNRLYGMTGSISSVNLASTASYIRVSDNNNISGSISSFANNNPQLTTIRLIRCGNLTGNVSELVANNSVTRFEVNGSQFVGTAAQIKEKFPNASIIDKDGGTA